MRSPAGATRSVVIAAVISIIMRTSIRPTTQSTAIGAAQLWAQSTPNRKPLRHDIIMLLGTVSAVTHARRQRRSRRAFQMDGSLIATIIAAVISAMAGEIIGSPRRIGVAVAQPDPSLVAAQRRAIEPLIHAPQSIQSTREC